MARKVALVTGASRGIGAATAVCLARDGFDVAVASRTVSDLEATAARCAEHGARTAVIPMDVLVEEQVRGMVAATVAQLGRLDALVNNAGWNSFTAPLTEIRPAGFDKSLSLNLTHVFWTLQEAGKVMAAEGGTVVNVASYAGIGASPGMAHYGAAKAALLSLTRTAAMEWGPHGVRVNAVAPGWVKTDISKFAWTDPGTEKAFVERSALGRWGQADEIAEVIAFLAGDKSSYITGQTVVADGGLFLGGG